MYDIPRILLNWHTLPLLQGSMITSDLVCKLILKVKNLRNVTFKCVHLILFLEKAGNFQSCASASVRT